MVRKKRQEFSLSLSKISVENGSALVRVSSKNMGESRQMALRYVIFLSFPPVPGSLYYFVRAIKKIWAEYKARRCCCVQKKKKKEID